METPAQIEIYQSKDNKTAVEVKLSGESLWLSQAQMAQVFDKDSDTIGLHLKNIYSEGELAPEATTEESSVVRQEGKRQVRHNINFCYQSEEVAPYGH